MSLFYFLIVIFVVFLGNLAAEVDTPRLHYFECVRNLTQSTHPSAASGNIPQPPRTRQEHSGAEPPSHTVGDPPLPVFRQDHHPGNAALARKDSKILSRQSSKVSIKQDVPTDAPVTLELKDNEYKDKDEVANPVKDNEHYDKNYKPSGDVSSYAPESVDVTYAENNVFEGEQYKPDVPDNAQYETQVAAEVPYDQSNVNTDYQNQDYREEYKQPDYSQQEQPDYSHQEYKQPDYSEQEYKQTDYNQQEYKQPDYSQPQEHKQPDYNQPEYKQPDYSQPENKQPDYSQPEYEQPGYTEYENYDLYPQQYTTEPNYENYATDGTYQGENYDNNQHNEEPVYADYQEPAEQVNLHANTEPVSDTKRSNTPNEKLATQS